jgi:nucleotide-binding universal stress UspA family protein
VDHACHVAAVLRVARSSGANLLSLLKRDGRRGGTIPFGDRPPREPAMYGRILVPLDGSPAAERGLREAIALARALNSHLLLLHVVEPVLYWPGDVGYSPQDLTQSLREAGAALLARAKAQVVAAGLTAETDLRDADGRVADTVVKAAEARAADLVVMGTHGRRGASRWVMGSDAELSARNSAVPVLLVHE